MTHSDPWALDVSCWDVFRSRFCRRGLHAQRGQGTYPFSHDRRWKFPQVKGNYPPNKRGNISHPSKNHFWVDDDFPAFPVGGICFLVCLEGNIFRYTHLPLNHACERTTIENFPTISGEKTWAYNGTGNLPPEKSPGSRRLSLKIMIDPISWFSSTKNLEIVSTETGFG